MGWIESGLSSTSPRRWEIVAIFDAKILRTRRNARTERPRLHELGLAQKVTVIHREEGVCFWDGGFGYGAGEREPRE